MQAPRQLTAESVWPNPTQELLLRAALGDGPFALESFCEWKTAAGVRKYSDVDFLATYLLPGVHCNLNRAGLADSWLAQMAGLHRYHFAKNGARRRSLAELIRQFNEHSLPFVVTGGFALLAGKYLDDLGERPFLDADLILAPSDAPAARRVLESLGWIAQAVAPPVAGWRSESWRGPEKQLLEVRFQWLPRPYPVVGIDRLLRHAQTVDFAGQSVRIPDAADLLVEACIGGRRFQNDAARQFLWVADAIRILQRSGNHLDWDRMLVESRAFCTLLALREAMEYIRVRFDLPISDAWLSDAWRIDIPAAELRPFYRSIRRKNSQSPAGIAVRRRPWDGYVTAERAAKRTPSAAGMMRYWVWRIASRRRTRKAAPRDDVAPSVSPNPLG